MQLLDGKALSEKIKNELKSESDILCSKGVTPCLAVILVGEDPASQTYVNSKEKSCHTAGIASIVKRLPASTS